MLKGIPPVLSPEQILEMWNSAAVKNDLSGEI